MSSDHPLSKQTCLVKEPAEWEWSSFRHDSLREVGMVEIESEWTRARSRNASSRRIRKTVSRPRARPEFVEGLAAKVRREPGAPGQLTLSSTAPNRHEGFEQHPRIIL